MVGKKIKIDEKDATASTIKYISGATNTFFLTHKFANGFYLGFFSDAPWGRQHNQERGWVIIDPVSNTIIDVCETYYWGSTGADFKGWLKGYKEKYGKTELLKNKWGDRYWKMSDCY